MRQLPEQCESCNIKFIGPKSKSIKMMGDKAVAKDTVRKAGVPIVPGSDGPVESEGDAVKIARKIGYPVIIKAVAGGGGRGGRGGAAAPTGPAPTPVTAVVTLPSGQKFEGPIVRYDDFVIAIRMQDSTERSFRRNGDVPKVEIRDPKDAHRKLWPTLSNADMHNVTAYLVTLK